jgi:hypothetical protein
MFSDMIWNTIEMGITGCLGSSFLTMNW